MKIITVPKFKVDQLVRVKATGYVGEVYSRILNLDGDSYCYKLIHGIDYEWYKEDELETAQEVTGGAANGQDH